MPCLKIKPRRVGGLKGQFLPEFPSNQTTLEKWISLYPNTLIMQPDKTFQVEYDSMQTYEKGKLTGKLTRRDTASWKAKSWIVGVEMGNQSKAFDWNKLQKEHIIHDEISGKPIVIIMSKDSSSFMAFERVNAAQHFTINNDTLVSNDLNTYNFIGISNNSKVSDLKRIKAYQEYWHSWQTFHNVPSIGN